MESIYLKGELLQIRMKNSEIFEGRFYSVNNDKTKISLYDVKESPNGNQHEGVCHYYDNEIHSVVKLQEPLHNKHLKISQKEIEDLTKISKKYIFINQVDKSYHNAMADLNEYNYLAISTDGASMGRKCKMPFLVISTPNQIYIFDIHVMQYHAFDGGLKKLLESESTKKIVHDCRKLADCLFHKHNVKLKCVFDTQVCDLIVTKNKRGVLPSTVKSLGECLNTYLGLTASVIEDKFDIVQCTERPLSIKIKDALAKNIVYLHHISKIIHEEMMLPFVRGVECFLENLRSADDYKAWELSTKHTQLPKEFKSIIDYNNVS